MGAWGEWAWARWWGQLSRLSHVLALGGWWGQVVARWGTLFLLGLPLRYLEQPVCSQPPGQPVLVIRAQPVLGPLGTSPGQPR